jgi:uncharacterized membrane protein YqiK
LHDRSAREHIDYRKAPLVIQRFGDIEKLVEQTLDPRAAACAADRRGAGRDVHAAAEGVGEGTRAA